VECADLPPLQALKEPRTGRGAERQSPSANMVLRLEAGTNNERI
jgi:hypothetical protein